MNKDRRNNRPVFHLCKRSNTIRILPENYCVANQAYADCQAFHWRMDPDLALNNNPRHRAMVVRCTLELLKHENKYGTGENLLNAITDTMNSGRPITATECIEGQTEMARQYGIIQGNFLQPFIDRVSEVLKRDPGIINVEEKGQS